jgi:hypothetical protein
MSGRISRLNQSRPSAEARGERSCRVGDRGAESPMHMTSGNRDIPIPDFPTELRIVVEDRCQKDNPCRETAPSGIGISQARRFVG